MIALAAALLSLAIATQRPDSGSLRCDSTSAAGVPGAFSPWCAELVAVPNLRTASGMLELRPARSPFGIAVTADGRPRVQLVTRVHGLPAPQSLGPYTVYVAWASTVSLDSIVRLGVVRNGVSALGEIALDQFRLLITAERSAHARTRSTALVLRGTSPSARLLAHRDLIAPTAPGTRTTGPSIAGDPHVAHGPLAGGWSMPPVPRGSPSTMMPGMAAMAPPVAAWRPGAGRDPDALPLARPREVLTVRTGDTIRLEAGLVRRRIAGKTFVMYAFNGQYPGPLIRAAAGATIIVRFHNALDLPSTVHWHGVRLENRSDGAEGVTQSAVAPGDSFVYRVHLRDAGLYWYHPHVREDIQQDLGLYGNILVAPERTAEPRAVHREELLILDDLLVGDDGPVAYGRESPTHALMGRFGNMMLVNGEPAWRLSVQRGEVVRLMLTNVSNTRIFNLSLPGARMKLVASDAGPFEHEEWVSSVVIAPAERYVVDVRFAASGEVAMLNRVQALDHLRGTFSAIEDTLGVFGVSGVSATPDRRASFERLRRRPDVAAVLSPYRRLLSSPPDQSLRIGFRGTALPAAVASMLNGLSVPVDWNDGMPMMNWLATGDSLAWVLRDQRTGRENMDINWQLRLGGTVKVRIFNDPAVSHAMDHPIHVHGQRFLVLARNGIANDNLVWKDTAVLPVGETLDLVIELSNPGRWMLHCHVAEHLGAGMMMVFDVK